VPVTLVSTTLFTGSIAGFMPGAFQAVYNGTKAFIDSFSFALRNELKDSGVTVTCLMPGATETDFFERAGMQDTRVGQSSKDDPADVARTGFDAMMRGDGDIVSGWKNKISTSLAAVTPSAMLAQQHRKMAEPLHDDGRHFRGQQHRDHHDDDHDNSSGLWSVMLPAGLAVAAGVALMSSSRSRQSHVGEHVDWTPKRSGFGAQRGAGYGGASRSSSYSEAGHMDATGHSQSWRSAQGGSRGAGPLEGAGSAAPQSGLHATAASRMPYETSNTGRQTVGETGAFRNARVDDPHGQRPVTE
jgi:hypothetical protein